MGTPVDHTIIVDDDVWQALQRRAVPLVDTPNSVLRRLLGFTEPGTNAGDLSSDNGPAAPTAGPRTPNVEFRGPILEILTDMGGRGPAREVHDRLRKRMNDRLTTRDLTTARSGQVRWWNAAQWERLRMVNDGLLRADSLRGVWELTELGRREAGGPSRTG